MKINITELRKAGGNDQAILDLLQLLDLGMVPGQPRTKELEALWGCHQSTVSRRMAAIYELRRCRASCHRLSLIRSWLECGGRTCASGGWRWWRDSQQFNTTYDT